MPIAFSDGNGRAFMGHQQCPCWHRFGPAIRDHFLLHFIIKGKGKLQTEDGEFALEQGEGFFIIPGEVTTYTADPDDPWEYLWVGVGATKENEAVLRRHGLESGVHCFVYRDKDELIPYLKRLTVETTLYNYEQAQGAFYLLMSTVDEEPVERMDKGHRYLQMSYDYMENAYSDSLTVESLAEHLNVSRSYLYRIFKSGLGISPQRAILNFRLEKAALLVEKGGISLTEIALSCGFCDLSHFSKAYKERYRSRPKAEQGKSRE
ncbi:MAG: helix-turn-helix domain-containing protein [Clostridia bacterium]|nr:helix-turn-helix domain-containing protein [Clostridia bacterium]